VFVANFKERIRSWAVQRIPQPKFFKPYRGFAGKDVKDKKSLYNNSLCVAEETVTSEPVSPANREKYREFWKFRPKLTVEHHQQAPNLAALLAKFPVNINKERTPAKQGPHLRKTADSD
jgi:hypothetical protein